MYPEIDFVEFVAVVKAGSFSKAALQLGTSKSHISKKISRLEQRLAVQLLHRSTRKMALTDVGRIYYQHCSQILEQVEQAQSMLHSSDAVASGTLNLSLPNTFGEQFIVPLVAEFMLENPQLKVNANITTRNTDLIDEGIDLAVRIGNLPDSQLIARELYQSPWLVCAHPNYLDRYGIPEHPEQLHEHACLVFSLYGVIENPSWTFSSTSDTQKFPVKGVFFSNNADALLAAARKSVGLIYIPEILMRKDIAENTLQPILTNWSTTTSISAVYPYSRHLVPKVRLLIDFLIDRMHKFGEKKSPHV